LPMPLLLHRQIPHIPRIPAVPQQCLLLLRGWQQSKPRHVRTVTASADTPGSQHASPRQNRLPTRTDVPSFQTGESIR
jgi:hypothetical protein